MYLKINCRFLNKSQKNYVIRIIEQSIKLNRFRLSKNQISLLIQIRERLLSRANVLDNLELILINDCISSLNLISRINKSKQILKSKKIKEVELRNRKLNKEKFKSIFFNCLSTFLLVILSISE